MDTNEFRKILAWLRKTFPIDAPVTVKRVPAKHNHGVTSFNGRRFFIRIDSIQEESGQLDTLLHEWAHAVAMNDAYTHGERWGQIYSRIYTAYEKKDDSKT
jgi:hypothetical protein